MTDTISIVNVGFFLYEIINISDMSIIKKYIIDISKNKIIKYITQIMGSLVSKVL